MSEPGTKGRTYKESGVDITAGDALVDALKPLTRATARPGAEAGLGGFGGLFDIAKAGYQDPVLISGTDGVGTKLLIAIETGRHDTIGIDLVAMCANDVLVHGAEPLFFLDYFACGKLDPAVAARVIGGVADGCRQAGCALIGGETAEMPDMYAAGHYDLAGFCVGAVERARILTGESIIAGDVALALPSSGMHANGFSLVRQIVADGGLDYAAPAPFAPEYSLAEALLRPTRIYVPDCLDALKEGVDIKAFCHITGGGLIENPPRVLPDGLALELDAARWTLPPLFRWLAEIGPIAPEELARTFNCGLGLLVFVGDDQADAAAAALGSDTRPVGRVVRAQDGAERCRIIGTETAWPR